jgi:7-keto-8-aminopelargonate synthetase-like enzyme
MAFIATKTKLDVMGSHRVQMGTFSQASGDTGGVVNTGLRVVDNFQMTSAKSVSVSGGAVTVVTPDPVATVAGFWIATGM